jgi:hypothetical protein
LNSVSGLGLGFCYGLALDFFISYTACKLTAAMCFAVQNHDRMPCWNMIGQKEDRLLYPNTGQAFSIDTISKETSRLAS